MITLFLLIIISTLLAPFPIYYFFSEKKNNESNKIKKIILGKLLPLASILVIISITIYFALLNIWACLMYIAIIVLFEIIIWCINNKEYFLSCLVLVLILIVGNLILNSKIENITSDIPSEIILLDEYNQDNLKDKKAIVIELSEKNGETKSYIIKTYNSNLTNVIDIPFYCDDLITDYEIISTGNSRIEILKTEKTFIKIFNHFELKIPEKEYNQSYKLYIYKDDIIYN